MSTDIDYNAKLGGTIGCLFWGVLAATALWGIGVLQTWYYFDMYRNDKKTNMYLVALVFLTDTTHQGLIMHAMYIYCIRDWGNLHAVDRVTASLYHDVTLNGITGFMVQGFYLHRIWVFQRNRLVLGFLTLLITGNLVMQLVYVVLGSSSPTFELLRTNVKAVGMTVNAMTAVCDVSITILICRNLYRVKTGFAWTDRVVHQLMIFTISTGMITSLCACSSLLFAIVLPNTLVYFGFYIIMGRLYQNSLLATLNARKALREATDHQSISMTNRRSSRNIHLTRETNGATPSTEIHIQIETTRDDGLGKDLEANAHRLSPQRVIEDQDISSKGDLSLLSIPGSRRYAI